MPTPAVEEQEWYAGGLRFECTMCGGCCTGAPGYVSFTDAEAKAIAAKLGVSKARFYREYAHKGEMGWSLNERRTAHGLDCVFLDRESIPGKAVCGLYEARPKQCRTFPWWPENLRSEAAWLRAGRSCEGVGRGRMVPIEEIRIQRDLQGGGK